MAVPYLAFRGGKVYFEIDILKADKTSSFVVGISGQNFSKHFPGADEMSWSIASNDLAYHK